MSPAIRLLNPSTAILLLTAGACLPGFVARPTGAAEGSIEVRVRIIEPIEVSGAQALDFGNVLPPSSDGETVYRLSPDGSLAVQGGDAAAHSGGHETGRFTFSGTDGVSYSYDASVTRDFSDPSLSLTAIHAGSLGKHQGNGVFRSAQSELAIGGDLKVNGIPSAGEYSDAEITLTVAYD